MKKKVFTYIVGTYIVITKIVKPEMIPLHWAAKGPHLGCLINL